MTNFKISRAFYKRKEKSARPGYSVERGRRKFGFRACEQKPGVPEAMQALEFKSKGAIPIRADFGYLRDISGDLNDIG